MVLNGLENIENKDFLLEEKNICIISYEKLYIIFSSPFFSIKKEHKKTINFDESLSLIWVARAKETTKM